MGIFRKDNTIRSLMIDLEGEADEFLNDITHERFVEWGLNKN